MELRDFLGALAVAVIIHRPDEILFANRAFATLIGDPDFRTPAGGGLGSLAGAEEGPPVRARARETLDGQASISTHELRLAPAGDRSLWVECVDQLVEWDGAAAIQTLVFDISERRQEEQVLRNSESRYRALIEDSRLGLLIHRDDRPLFANQKLADLLGYASVDDVLAVPYIAAHQLPGDRERMKRIGQARLRGEPAPEQYDLELRRADGSPIWLDIRARAVTWDSEPAIEMAMSDITARVTAERALAESERRFRDLIEGSAQGILVFRDETPLFANQALADILGYTSPASIMAASPVDAFIHPEDRDLTRQYRDARARGEPAPDDYDIRALRADGSVIWLNLRPTITRWDGEPAFLVTYFDVTDRMRAEAAQRQSEQRYRDLVENSMQGLIVHRNDKPLYVNQAFATMCGWDSPDDVMRFDSVDEYVAPEERERLRNYREHRARGEAAPPSYTFLALRKDGSTFWMESRHARIDWEGKPAVQSVFFDVNARIEAESARRESETYFRTLLEESEQAVAIRQGQRIVFANHAFADVFGYAEVEDVYALPSVTKLFATERAEWVKDLVAARLSDNTPEMEYEFIGLRKDGSELWLQNRAQEIVWNDAPASLAFVEDISERKRAEAALSALNKELESRVAIRSRELAEKSEQLRASLDNISQGFVWYDENDELVFCNESFAQLAPAISHLIKPGVSYETVLRASIAYGVVEHPGADVEEQVQRRLEKHREPKGDFEVALKDGRWLTLSERKTHDGGTVMVQTDITEVKRAEQEARSILDANPFAVGVSRIADGTLLYVNARYAELFNVAEDEVLGRPAIENWAVPAERERLLEIFRRDSRVPETEVTMKRSDGSTFPVQVVWERIPAFGEDTVLFWNQDISDLVAARENLEHAKEEAETANRAKSEFLSQMSHELRTPLNAVLGFAQVMRDFADPPLSGETAEHLHQIISGAKHLGELIEDVLDLSRIETGRLDIAPLAMALAPFLDECLMLAGPMAEVRDITIIDKVDRQAIGHAVADPTRLKQVLLNLLSNAVKYNREGGSIVIEASDGAEGMLRLSVTDGGPGIPLDRHGEVFQAFSRLGVERRGIEGTGIGLTISRELMGLMGGALDFESTLGNGSRFWLDVPNSKQ